MRCMRYTYVHNMIYMIYSSFLHSGAWGCAPAPGGTGVGRLPAVC